MQSLSTREKIAHLLRRFGTGATKGDLDRLEPLGVDRTLDWLIEYAKQDEGFAIQPYEVCFEDGKDEVYVDAFRFAGIWGLRMVLSQRPLEQKLALFWHDHFAVSAAKVEFGPAMWDYLEVIRMHALDFPKLLSTITREPAMLRYLDADTSIKQNPNENFARELLELFTLGQGNFTEKDIDEVSRAFTGWGIRYLIYESGGEQVQERMREAILKGTTMLTASYSPALHDDGVKTILGKQMRSPDEVLAFLSTHPMTAKYVTGKLWDFFVGAPIKAGTHERLVKEYLDSNGALSGVLRLMAKSDEFWSESCLRQRVKSPAEFVVPIVRQLGLNPIISNFYVRTDNRSRPLRKELRDVAGLVVGTMYQQGMLPFFPPNVGGWEWGDAWITSNNMLARMNMADLICGVGQNDQPIAAFIAQQATASQPSSSADVVAFLDQMFDAGLPSAKKALLAEAFDKHGGVDSLKTKLDASKSLSQVLRLMFGSPEFQMC